MSSEFKPVENPVFTYELERPIQYLGAAITSVAIREPTAGDMFRVGNPVKFDTKDNLEFDEQKAMLMLSRLSGIPIEGSLEKMSCNDAVGLFWGFARFFLPGLRTTAPGQSSS